MLTRVKPQCIGVYDFEPAGTGPGNLRKGWNAAPVRFDRQDPARAFGEKAPRETSRTGANLQHVGI